MKMSKLLVSTGLTALALVSAATALALTKSEIDGRASTALVQFDGLNASNKSLGDKAAGILVSPRLTEGGAGIAAEFGEGVLEIDGKTVGYYSLAAIGWTDARRC